jgi:putative peptidoglycan lipid II flippase
LAGIVWAEPVVSLISRGFEGDAVKLAEATRLSRIMMPILFLVSVGAVWMGMLNARQRYMAPAIAPAMFNVTSIACGLGLVALAMGDRAGILVWSVGTTVAALVQALVQLPVLWRLGYRPGFAFAALFRDPDVRHILRLMGPATIGLAAVQINVLVNTQFAASLGDGPLTYLNNAFRLFYLPIGLFGVALATVTTAQIAADAARDDREALVARVEEGARGVWLLALPSAVGLIVLAEPIVALLFQRGRFLPVDTANTVPVVQAYMLGVLPYSLAKVYAPAFFAVGRSRLPMMASIAAVIVNLVFSALTYRRLGASGLALGTALASVVNVAVLQVAFRRTVGQPGSGGAGRRAVAVVLGNVTVAAVAAGLWHGGVSVVGASGAGLLFGVILAAFIAYVAVMRAMRYPGAEELAALPRRLLARR